MPWKVTLLLVQPTGPGGGGSGTETRVAGWTESYYSSLSSVQAVRDLLTIDQPGFVCLANARAQLLPNQGSVIGYRIAAVFPRSGRAQTANLNLPGGSGQDTDLPNMSLLCSINSKTSNNVRRFGIRDVPDSVIEFGEYKSTLGYNAKLTDFFNSLDDWQFVGQNLLVLYQDISSIDATGLVTFLVPQTITPGTLVQFTGLTLPSTGQKFTGRWKVKVGIVGGTVITLLNYLLPATTGGKARVVTFDLFGMNASTGTIGRAVSRKVGRPFAQFVGRRSKRRVM